MIVALILLVIAGYILGSIPFGYVIGRFVSKDDIRKKGSGNIGATNVSRVVGFKWGLLTVFLDALKAVIPLLALKNALLMDSVFDRYVICATGFSIILGHIFSIFLNFKGGKGVAAFVGVILALKPIEALVCLLVFVVVLAITRYVSLSSMIAVSIFPVSIIVSGGINPETLPYIILSVLLMMTVIIRHKPNIIRLKNHEESKFSIKKKE